MTYLDDLHSYLHQSSLLIQAYPSTRITTKYSLPRKPNTKTRTKPENGTTTTPRTTDSAAAPSQQQQQQLQPKREPSAVLTLKTYHADSGICLKYRTDKAAEVGRLLNGLGRLAKGEIIEMPTTTATATQIEAGQPAAAAADGGDKMDIDGGLVSAPKVEDKVVTAPPATSQTTGGGAGGGKGKKKKGKK
ncbi:hypothetical protein ABEF95_011971 [Exophiala dermatitidis]